MTTGRNDESGSAGSESSGVPGIGPELHEPRWWRYVRVAPLAPQGAASAGDAERTQFVPVPEAPAEAVAPPAPDDPRVDEAEPTGFEPAREEPAASEAEPMYVPPPPREAPRVGGPEPTGFVPPQDEEPSASESEAMYVAPTPLRKEPRASAAEPVPVPTAPLPEDSGTSEAWPMYVSPSLPDAPDADPMNAPQGAPPVPSAPEPTGTEGPDSSPPVPHSQEDFGWNFEQTRAESFEWFPAPKRLPLWVAFVIAGLLILVIGSVWVMVQSKGGNEAEAPPTAAPPAPATLMSPEAAAPFRPQAVSVRSFEGRLLVSWKLPQRTDLVVGYLVIAQDRDGSVQKTEVPRAGELTAVLAGAPVGPNSCVVVTTLVNGEPSMMMSRSDPVCPRPSAPSSDSPSSARSGAPGSSAGSSAGADG